MLNIINDLINISKIKSGQTNFNTTETNNNGQIRPELTMIAQTAYAFEHDIENYKDPFDGYITKPIKTEEIKQLICNELYNNKVC